MTELLWGNEPVRTRGPKPAITLTAIPLSLAAAFLTLRAFGATVNTMTLGGMAIAIGALVWSVRLRRVSLVLIAVVMAAALSMSLARVGLPSQLENLIVNDSQRAVFP